MSTASLLTFFSWLCFIGMAAAFWRHHRRLKIALATLAQDQRDARYHRISSENADAGLLVQTMDGTTLWANEAYYNIMKRTEEEVIGHNPLSFALPPELTPSAAEIAAFRYDPNDTEAEKTVLRNNIRGDGKRIWMELSVAFHDDHDNTKKAILVCRDVTLNIEREQQLQATSERLAHIAAHDSLTGLANRSEFSRFVTAEMARSDANNRLGLLHIDLDKFKHINDTHGHSAGDTVLIAIAQRMRDSLRDTDLIARIGGDEFVAVCTGLQTLTQLQEIGQQLVTAVNCPIPWEGRTLHCRISVGAALSNDAAHSAEDLLQQSDFALYEVKQTGRGRVATYNHQMHKRHKRQTELARDLRQTVQSGGLAFHFQPVVGISPGDICGLETLVRWQHPSEGLIAPGDFLPIAESLGIMADIDFLAMEAAMNLKMRLNATAHRHLRVGFNTSSQVLSHPDFIERMKFSVAARGINPDEIIVEVLETVVFGNHQRQTPMIKVIADLDALGFTIFLDDFGSGNAGLAHLAKLAIKGVKIDRSLTQGLLSDPMTKTIFSTLITLCADLDLKVTTEGVENADQATVIAALGGATIQGYWVSRPLPEDKIIAWLDANSNCSKSDPLLVNDQRIA